MDSAQGQPSLSEATLGKQHATGKQTQDFSTRPADQQRLQKAPQHTSLAESTSASQPHDPRPYLSTLHRFIHIPNSLWGFDPMATAQRRF